jgi:hypothetical protein
MRRFTLECSPWFPNSPGDLSIQAADAHSNSSADIEDRISGNCSQESFPFKASISNLQTLASGSESGRFYSAFVVLELSGAVNSSSFPKVSMKMQSAWNTLYSCTPSFLARNDDVVHATTVSPQEKVPLEPTPSFWMTILC